MKHPQNLNTADNTAHRAASPLIEQIDEMIAERSLLKHPFYLKWIAGTLTQEALAGYSREYYQLVRNVPLFMDAIIAQAPAGALREELEENRQEEVEHIAPWKQFAAALGVTEAELDGYDGQEQTRRAVAMLSATTSDLEGGASAMYAFEKEIPAISQTKLDGLKRFYGIDGDGAAYFHLHTEADIRHAASWVALLEQANSPMTRLLTAADTSISALNLLLDGCEESYCPD